MSKISQYTALAVPASNDLLPIVDVDDNTMAGSGTDKSVTVAALLAALGTPLTLQAATPLAGVALINGTQNFVSWTAPNDGQMHRVLLIAQLWVASTETGGLVIQTGTDPGGNAFSLTVMSAGLGTGAHTTGFPATLIKAGTTFTVSQSTALTAGATTLWAEIWGL